MNDAIGIADRLDALESRIAYQDDTIETLNAAITAQWSEVDALRRQIATLSERLQQAENNADAGVAITDERPPHY